MERTPSARLSVLRLRWIALFGLLLGCDACKSPAPPPPETPANTGSAGTSAGNGFAAANAPAKAAGCPAATDLRIASFGSDAPKAAQRWRLHEKLFEDALKQDFDPMGEEELITPERARKLGSALSDEPVWIFGRNGEPPCRMTPRESMLVHVRTGPTYSRLVRVLDGDCSKGTGQAPRIAVQQAIAPTECQWHEVGNSTDSAARALIPQKACEAPKCEFRSRVRGASATSRAAVEVTATWLYPKGDDECAWKHEDFFGVFMRYGASDTPRRLNDDLSLFGLLSAENGGSVVVTYEPGMMRFHSAVEGQEPVRAAEIRTDVLVEAQEGHSLARDCGP